MVVVVNNRLITSPHLNENVWLPPLWYWVHSSITWSLTIPARVTFEPKTIGQAVAALATTLMRLQYVKFIFKTGDLVGTHLCMKFIIT